MDAVTRYRLNVLPQMQFVRRPASMLPEDGTMCLIDRGTVERADRYTPATYRDGKWCNLSGRPFSQPPTFWTEMMSDGQ